MILLGILILHHTVLSKKLIFKIVFMAVHQNSLANLKPNRSGSKPKYGEPKKKRTITVTDEGWDRVRQLMKGEYGMSLSEAIEQLARGEYMLVKVSD